MIRDKKAFRDTMYAYDNINEYFSFYGDVVYISSDYLLKNDYFVILKNENKFAFIPVSIAEQQRFAKFENRDNLIEELEGLAKYVEFTEGFENFTHTIAWHLLNTYLEPKSKNEAIKLKNSPYVYWNCFMLESIIAIHKLAKTLAPKPLLHDTRQLNRDIWTSVVTAPNAYNTNFTLTFDWVAGNPFMDMEIIHFTHRMKRRLYMYDIVELSQVFQIMARGDEYKTFEVLREFAGLN